MNPFEMESAGRGMAQETVTPGEMLEKGQDALTTADPVGVHGEAGAGAGEAGTERLFYSIGEVSSMTGIEPYVLRYWESEFKLLHPNKRSSGQRSYQKRDIETILTIKKLLYEDLYTIAGARKKLREDRAQEHEDKANLSSVVMGKILVREDHQQLLKDVRVHLGDLEKEIRGY